VGLGLISGSLAGALKRGNWRADLIAWGPRAPSLERGLALGLIDRFSLDLESVVAEADVVVIGAPPEATARLLPSVLDLARRSGEPVVTDMASIKGLIVESAVPAYSRFVPGHPIAGSEHSGVQAAIPELFQGREVILTPAADTDASAVRTVERLWEAAGARLTSMSVEDHDAALAASSHMPHMVAFALTAMLSDHHLAPMKHGGVRCEI
jgi:prephenate dehydrogenase